MKGNHMPRNAYTPWAQNQRSLEDILSDTTRGDCTQFYPPPREPHHVMVRRDDGSVVDPLVDSLFAADYMDFNWVDALKALHGVST